MSKWNINKVRFFGITLCILVFISAVIAVSIVAANSVPAVHDLAVDKTTDVSVSFAWTADDRVDGYVLFYKGAADDDYSVSTEINDPSAAKCTVENLAPYTEYDFYIAGYIGDGDDRLTGKEYGDITVRTLPKRPTVTADSTMNGELDIKWTRIDNVSGYEVSYDGGKDSGSVEFSGNSRHSVSYTDRIVGAEYTVRVRSYVVDKKEKVYSPWSDADKVVISNHRIQSKTIDPNKPMIALSFDDGPTSKSSSKRILDVLEQYNARATFFMLGRSAKANPENLKRKVALGMEIGNHTYDHEHYGKQINKNDIYKATTAIKEACGAAPTAFRSPGGMTNDFIRNECSAEGMVLFYWSLDTLDWKYRNADKVYNIVMNNVSDGDIILMHEIYGTTADAVERMVPELIARGYQLVTCSELIRYKTGADPQPGTQYVDFDTIKNNTQ